MKLCKVFLKPGLPAVRCMVRFPVPPLHTPPHGPQGKPPSGRLSGAACGRPLRPGRQAGAALRTLSLQGPACCTPTPLPFAAAPPRDPMQGRKARTPTAAGRPPAAGKRAKPVSAVRSTAGPAAAACPLYKPANFPLSGAVSLAPPVPICYNRSNRPPRGGKIRLEVRLWACSIKDPPAPSAAER